MADTMHNGHMAAEQSCSWASVTLLQRPYGHCVAQWVRPANGTIEETRHKLQRHEPCYRIAIGIPSQTVGSGCGRRVPKEVAARWQRRPYEAYGLSLHRDPNAARAILTRTGLADPRRGYPVASAPAAETQAL